MIAPTDSNPLAVYAACVFEPEDIVEVRCLPKGDKPTHCEWHPASELPARIEFLRRKNAADFNVYVGANPRTAIGEKNKEGTALARTLFVDFDGGATPDDARQRIEGAGLPEPTLIVASGHGCHTYWRLMEPISDLAAWTAMQKRLIKALGSDASIHDPPRIMRAPGFQNVKSEPVPCEVVAADASRVYVIESFDAVLPMLTVSATPPTARPQASLSADKVMARIEAYVDKLDPSISGDHGHDRLYRAACVLVIDWGLSEDEAYRILACRFNPRCVPEWSEWELRRKVSEAAKQPGERGRLLNNQGVHQNGNQVGQVDSGKQAVLDVWQPEGRTDAANAQRFIARYGSRAAFCDPHNAWYLFTGKHWQQDRERQVEKWARKMAGELWATVKAAAEKKMNEKFMAELVRFAKSSNSANGIRNTLMMARSEVAILPERFDADGMLLNCNNGTLDLRTGELRPHSREDWLTKICPTNYNPDAASFVFDRFLEAVYDGNQSLIDFEQRYSGYCLTGEVFEQIVAILYGGGSNGKSTLLNAKAAVVGTDYYMQAPHGFLMAMKGERHSTEQYDLRGRRFVSAVETGNGRRLDEELVKALTGGEQVRARKLYADHEQFPPTHKLSICSNFKPDIHGTDHAIWRRIALVPFTVRFWNPDKGETGPPELRQDKALPKKLAAEAEGILAWMVRGCLAWQSGGLRMPAVVADATEGYRSEQDVIGRFISERCIQCSGKTPFKQLYEALGAWCKEFGDNPPSRKVMAEWLGANGYEREMSRSRPYRGIGLLADHNEGDVQR